MTDHAQHNHHLCIVNVSGIDGAYHPELQFGQDIVLSLERDVAVPYALSLLRAASDAEYDANVMKQMLVISDDRAGASLMVSAVRDFRPDPVPSSLPITFRPILDADKVEPWVEVSVNGTFVGSWSLETARSHAMACLEAEREAHSDQAYRAVLVDVVDLDLSTAQTIVGRRRDPVIAGQ